VHVDQTRHQRLAAHVDDARAGRRRNRASDAGDPVLAAGRRRVVRGQFASAALPVTRYPVISGMSRRVRYSRIAITLPSTELAAADRLARELDRPRSWVIAEAVRRFAAIGSTPAGLSGPQPQPTDGLGASRTKQLLADLALSPEARVRAAEETAGVSFARRPTLGTRVIAFDRYEEYLAWKRREEAGG
jgi:hypothetical protein